MALRELEVRSTSTSILATPHTPHTLHIDHAHHFYRPRYYCRCRHTAGAQYGPQNLDATTKTQNALRKFGKLDKTSGSSAVWM